MIFKRDIVLDSFCSSFFNTFCFALNLQSKVSSGKLPTIGKVSAFLCARVIGEESEAFLPEGW